MPGPLPAVPGAKVVGALERAGFTVVRISRSHHMMRHPDGRTVVVPVHAGRDIAKGTLRNILAIIGMAMILIPDEGPVEELAPTPADPAFGDGVHARRPDVAEHGPDSGIGEDGVECAGTAAATPLAAWSAGT
jgi:predicted RNA binding protein YcfA (HicA-like mRNA interferase family)